MKVAMYHKNDDVRVEEMPKPQISEGEILVKMAVCGICGSDVMEWYRIKKAPLVLGHEMVGTIAESKSAKYKAGQRVFVSHHVPCMMCHYCQHGHHIACETLHKTNFYPGGLAEYIRVPKINVEYGVYVLPDDVNFDQGSFVEPLACIVRGQRLMGVKPNDTVLVIGSGVSGIMHVKLAKALGVRRVFVVDIHEFRVNAAIQFGADGGINSLINKPEQVVSKLMQMNEGRKADKVIVCSSALEAAKLSFECVDKGGKILFFAVPSPDKKVEAPMNDFWKNEVTLLTSYGAAPVDLKESLELIRSGKVEVEDMISHRIKLDDVQKAFDLVAKAQDSLKVVVKAE